MQVCISFFFFFYRNNTKPKQESFDFKAPQAPPPPAPTQAPLAQVKIRSPPNLSRVLCTPVCLVPNEPKQ